MNTKDLDILFDEAFDNANKIEKESVAPNMQLVLYGLYKHATSTRPSLNIEASQDANDLKNAFKMNAWMQVNSLSIDEAKEQYIEHINKLLKERNL